MIEITIPGIPTAKGRPRAVRMGKKGVRMYTPEKTANYEAVCKMAALEVMAWRAPLRGPLLVTFFLHMPIPASLSLKKQAELNGKPHVKKPDTSNCVKAVEDALNGIVWHDDSQIAHLTAHKVYSLEPRVVVRVSEVLDLEAA
jgi:Holliday junction resolvase RusA-like endonuclease